MKFVRYGLILAAVALTVIAKVYWRPYQTEPEQSYRPITPKPADYAEYEIELLSGDGEEPIAVYKATYFPKGRDSDGRYYVKLPEGERRELVKDYTVLYLCPEKMAEGHFVIFSSVYMEDGEGRRERSVPSISTGLPAFDPLIGAGYLAFDTRKMQSDLKLVITYVVNPGRDDAYGPAFAEAAIRSD